METYKTDPVEYQTKCEILMDLCIKWFERFPAITRNDYDKLMTNSQEVFDKHEDKN